ncbi:ATP-grasp domain-containing protein [archaeon]|nr:ATP-grasp domain-containing protein [archaeon]
MSVFLFEYATCGAFAELEPSITVEGMGMFKTLESGFEDVSTFIDSRISDFDNFPRVKNYEELFFDYSEKSDFFLVIAPESAGVLHNLTVEAEKSGNVNLGSTPGAIEIAADKLATYEALHGLQTPKTELYDSSTSLNFPLIAKPRDGVSCEGVALLRNEDELKNVPEGYLLQEYVKGTPASATLLVGDEVQILSLNTQEIEDFKYTGAKIPLETDAETEEIIKAAERIKGLHGLVGIDFILNDRVNIIEINPRPTTPIIALNDVYGFNISKLVLDNYYHERIPNFEAKKSVTLKKGSKKQNSFVSFGDYSIWIQ